MTSPKVKDHSLQAQDFKSGQLPAGAPGLQGAPGARGPSDGYSTNATKIVNFITGEEQVLDSITLPAGKYILTSYANANNNAASVQEANCRIMLGETEIAETESVPLGPNTESDQEELALTGGGTLAASGVAVLRCGVSTSEGSWLRSGLTAIQVASLNGS